METFTPQPLADDELMKPKEIAADLRVSDPTVWRMFRDRQLDRVCIRGRTFGRRSQVIPSP